MLYFLDICLTFVHVAVIFFNLFGWIPRVTRKAHLVSIALTAASWFLLGIWFGMGYCPFADWQWEVKERLGEQNLPSNFIGYMAESIIAKDIDTGLASTATAAGFALAALMSVYVNFVLPKSRPQYKSALPLKTENGSNRS